MTNKIRVLMFGPALDATGGISNVVVNWINAEIEQDIDLRYVETLIQNKSGQYFRKFSYGLRSYYKFIITKSAEYDLIHIHISSGMSFYRKLIIFVIAYLRRDKIFVHLHGSEFENFYYSGFRMQKWVITWLFNHASVVIVLSKEWKKFIQEICANQNVSILYNGAIPEQFAPEIRDPNKINILFMGRLGSRKGAFDLIHSFSHVHGKIPGIKLVLGGDGEIGKAQSLVAEYGIENSVEIRGWISGQEKIDAFRNAHIYVLPSYNEGLPGSIMEAMAAGLPIISTPVGGIPEAVIDNVNGRLVNPGDIDSLSDAIFELCNDEILRISMGKESLKMICSKFHTKIIVSQLLKIYKQKITF